MVGRPGLGPWDHGQSSALRLGLRVGSEPRSLSLNFERAAYLKRKFLVVDFK